MFPYLALFLLLLCPAAGQRAKPGDFPWRLRLALANESDVFQGALKFDVYFDSKSNRPQSIVIDHRKYEPDSIQVSLQKLNEAGAMNAIARIEASAIDDSGNCVPNRTVVIKEISLTSFHKRRIFRKIFNDSHLLHVHPQCKSISNSSLQKTISIIENFESIASGDCYYQGEFYQANRSFEIGCDMKCYCKDGMVECDSMCKPFGSTLPRNCRLASVDRKCCDEVECMEDALWDSCPIHIASRDRMPPWAVVLTVPEVDGQNGTKRTCGASIIHKKLLITSAHCVQKSQGGNEESAGSIFVSNSVSSSDAIGRAKAVHIHPAYTGNDPSADLALVELAQEGIEFGEEVRRVNLPWPTLCKRYVVSGCAVQYSTVDEYDSFIGKVVPAAKFCPFSMSNSISQPQQSFSKSQIENGTEPLFCMQRTTDGFAKRNSSENDHGQQCDQENGNGVVTKRAQYHYLIGVIADDYGKKSIADQYKFGTAVDAAPDSRLGPILARHRRNEQTGKQVKEQNAVDEDTGEGNQRSCGRRYIPVTNLCPHIDWLKNTISEILERE